MAKKASNFSVDSRGYCFFCLSKISSQLQYTPVKIHDTLNVPRHPSSVHFLHDISRYLKIDMRKVFMEGESVPSPLLAKVEKSRLKVELCDGCGSLADYISKRCRQLEKLKLEIESGLESIHLKISDANKIGRTEQLRGAAATGFAANSGMGNWMDIVGVLRMEAMQKCFLKIRTSSPRPRIQKLKSEEIRRHTTRIPNNEAETSLEQITEFQCNSIKIETPDNLNLELENDDEHDAHSFVDYFGDGTDEPNPTPTVVTDEVKIKQMRLTHRKPTHQNMKVTIGNNLQKKWTLNPDTEKYKCQLCSMEYASLKGFSKHFNTIHRKIRFKCTICGKDFTERNKYKIHHQNVHLGLRFECQVCKKLFTLRNHLLTHQRKGGCVGVGQSVN